MDKLRKRAQKIVSEIEQELGIPIMSFTTEDIQLLKDKLDSFIDTGVEIDELYGEDEDDATFDEDESY